MIVYRYNHEVNRPDVRAFLNEALSVMSVFTGRAMNGWESAPPE